MRVVNVPTARRRPAPCRPMRSGSVRHHAAVERDVEQFPAGPFQRTCVPPVVETGVRAPGLETAGRKSRASRFVRLMRSRRRVVSAALLEFRLDGDGLPIGCRQCPQVVAALGMMSLNRMKRPSEDQSSGRAFDRPAVVGRKNPERGHRHRFLGGVTPRLLLHAVDDPAAVRRPQGKTSLPGSDVNLSILSRLVSNNQISVFPSTVREIATWRVSGESEACDASRSPIVRVAKGRSRNSMTRGLCSTAAGPPRQLGRALPGCREAEAALQGHALGHREWVPAGEPRERIEALRVERALSDEQQVPRRCVDRGGICGQHTARLGAIEAGHVYAPRLRRAPDVIEEVSPIRQHLREAMAELRRMHLGHRLRLAA